MNGPNKTHQHLRQTADVRIFHNIVTNNIVKNPKKAYICLKIKGNER